MQAQHTTNQAAQQQQNFDAAAYVVRVLDNGVVVMEETDEIILDL